MFRVYPDATLDEDIRLPKLQTLPMRKISLAVAMPSVTSLILAGCLCISIAMLVDDPRLQLGFNISGTVLCIGAGLRWLYDVAGMLTGWWQRANAARMIAHDEGASFVTSADGAVTYANPRAQARFEVENGAALWQVFRHMLANPAGLLSQLTQQAAAHGVYIEDIVTRRGHFRLRVLLIGPECHVWWLDDLTDATASTHQSAETGVFPMLTVAPDGGVLDSNAAFRGLVGEKIQALGDVIRDMPLRSGQVHYVRSVDGYQRKVVIEVAGKNGNCDVYLLPGAEAQPSPPQLEGGWDAIDDLPVPLLKIARDGCLLGSNREARQLLRIGETEGRYLADVLDGPGRPINDWLHEALTGRGGHVSQFLRSKAGSGDTHVQVILSTAGEADDLHLIAVLNDVTELKTLEAQFVQNQKMQAIGQLAGGVAHDFNNLLTAISGHCDLLLLRHDEGDQNYGDLIQIHQNANRAASLVGQLLAFSRKQNLQPETIDLRDTLSDLTHLLNRLVGEKVTLTLDHDPALMRIKADKRQLEQVLMNLVVNARDAMDGAGAIKVATKNMTLQSEMVRERATVPKGNYVMVTVADDGHGISPEKLHKIFEPFYTTKRTGEGTGLGLSTAYGIVKQTGGYIFADSEVGRGTTFSLLFPSWQTEVAAPMTLAKPQKEPLKTRTDGVVLLVEDEAPVRAFASRALRLRGFTVLEADCAEAAMDLLSDPDLCVDVFVTDVIMPGMDGPTWVRQALKDRPDTRVVFVSGYPEDAFDDGEAHIPDAIFLPKPFSLTALTQTVQAQLESVKEPDLEPA